MRTGFKIGLVAMGLLTCSASLAEPMETPSSSLDRSPSQDTTTTPHFQKGDGAVVSRMLAALLGLGAIGGLAWFITKRSGAPLAGWLKQQGAAKGAIEIVQIRRVSPRLTIVALNIPGERQIVLADNGQALLVLSERGLGSAAAESA